jgi:adenosine deaminase
MPARNRIIAYSGRRPFTVHALCSYQHGAVPEENDIVLLDEFAVPAHEFKAYEHFVQSYYRNLQLIAAANNYYFVAFKVM